MLSPGKKIGCDVPGETNWGGVNLGLWAVNFYTSHTITLLILLKWIFPNHTQIMHKLDYNLYNEISLK